MTIPFTIFLLSLAALVFLIVHKMLELRKGAPLVSTGMRDRGDEIITDNIMENAKLLVAKAWLACRRWALALKGFVQRGTVHALHVVQHLLVKLIERTKYAGVKSTGSAPAGGGKKGPGSVSFFLKHVSDEAKRVAGESAAAGPETPYPAAVESVKETK